MSETARYLRLHGLCKLNPNGISKKKIRFPHSIRGITILFLAPLSMSLVLHFP